MEWVGAIIIFLPVIVLAVMFFIVGDYYDVDIDD